MEAQVTIILTCPPTGGVHKNCYEPQDRFSKGHTDQSCGSGPAPASGVCDARSQAVTNLLPLLRHASVCALGLEGGDQIDAVDLRLSRRGTDTGCRARIDFHSFFNVPSIRRRFFLPGRGVALRYGLAGNRSSHLIQE